MFSKEEEKNRIWNERSLCSHFEKTRLIENWLSFPSEISNSIFLKTKKLYSFYSSSSPPPPLIFLVGCIIVIITRVYAVRVIFLKKKKDNALENYYFLLKEIYFINTIRVYLFNLNHRIPLNILSIIIWQLFIKFSIGRH